MITSYEKFIKGTKIESQLKYRVRGVPLGDLYQMELGIGRRMFAD